MMTSPWPLCSPGEACPLQRCASRHARAHAHARWTDRNKARMHITRTNPSAHHPFTTDTASFALSQCAACAAFAAAADAARRRAHVQAGRADLHGPGRSHQSRLGTAPP